MEEIYTKKNIYHKNNPYNELKKMVLFTQI